MYNLEHCGFVEKISSVMTNTGMPFVLLNKIKYKFQQNFWCDMTLFCQPGANENLSAVILLII